MAASQAEVSVPTAPASVAPAPTTEPEPTPDQPDVTPTKGDWMSTIVTDSFSVDKVIGETKFHTINLDYTISGDLIETGQEHGSETGSLVAHGFTYFTGTIGDR